MPQGESFARHALITQNYFKEKFGIYAKTGYNVDSFGHNGNLPKILRASRMENYVFMRPGVREKTLPSNLFTWESDDGSKVLTYRIPFSYSLGTNPEKFSLIYDVQSLPGNKDEMAFYGVGNHGGGPTVEMLEQMHRELDDRFVFSTPDKYFDSVKGEDVPTVKDDLQFHAKGCYSACAEIKKNNRYAENALLSAERTSMLSGALLGTPYPEKELNYAWQRVLFNQFHDILCGCSIREAYDDAREVHGEALSIAHRIENFARQQISWNINTLSNHRGGCVTESEREAIGTPIVIFNTLDYDVSCPVFVRSGIYNGARDENGNAVPIQSVRDSKTNGAKDHFARIIEAKIPALGYAVYRMYKTPTGAEEDNPFNVGESFIENEKLRIEFDRNSGELISVFDLEEKKELLSGGSEIKLFDDSANDTWAHGTEFFRSEVNVCVKGKVTVIESGPVRATVRAVQHFGNSTVIRDYSLTRGKKNIDVKVKIDFHEKHRILKFTYPVATDNPRAYAKIPFGNIECKNDGSESVCGDYVVLMGESGGITISNDSKHSFDAEGNRLSLTVLRSAIFADHYGTRDEFCEFMEQGEHTFNYRISPFVSFADAERNAKELAFPPAVIKETFHAGTLPESYRGLSVKDENVSLTALKMQRCKKGTVLRVYETNGKDTNAELSLFGNDIKFDLSHNSIKTLLINGSDAKEIDFLE